MSGHHDDFEFEPIPGLPESPPEGEQVLWSGSPLKWRLGPHVFRTKWILVLFAILAVSSIFSGLNHGAGFTRIAVTFATMLFLGGLIALFFTLMGWLIAINTIYTITNKRLVIRHGVTMPMTINVPFAKVARADAKVRRDGTADISLALLDGNRLSIFAIWPHNRPWSWQSAAPAMRMVPDGAKVADILVNALTRELQADSKIRATMRPKVVRTRGQYMPVPAEQPEPAIHSASA
jgi:hypothetical protein